MLKDYKHLAYRDGKKTLQRRQTGVSCGDAEGKGNGKIAQCDGNAVAHAV